MNRTLKRKGCLSGIKENLNIMKINSILKGSAFTFLVAGLLSISTIASAQTKPAQKAAKKDTAKKEQVAKPAQKEEKVATGKSAKPAKKH